MLSEMCSGARILLQFTYPFGAMMFEYYKDLEMPQHDEYHIYNIVIAPGNCRSAGTVNHVDQLGHGKR